MPKMIDRDRIQSALRSVHERERCTRNPNGLPRAVAARDAIRDHGLNADETAILLSGILVAPHEVAS